VNVSADDDVTRRTRLAAERTWLAWWRSGIAAATAAVAVGGVVPQLVDGSRTPYALLGAGYVVLAAAIFLAAGLRRLQVERALDRGEYVEIGVRAVLAMTAAALVLSLGTLAIIVVQP
jgi:putative membrane protein